VWNWQISIAMIRFRHLYKMKKSASGGKEVHFQVCKAGGRPLESRAFRRSLEVFRSL